MLTITKNEAAQVLDTLRQARDDTYLDAEDYEEAITIMEDVLSGYDTPIEELIQ